MITWHTNVFTGKKKSVKSDFGIQIAFKKYGERVKRNDHPRLITSGITGSTPVLATKNPTSAV